MSLATDGAGTLPGVVVPDEPTAARAIARLPAARAAAAGLAAGLLGGVVYWALLVGQPDLAMTSGMSGLPAAQAGLGAHLAISVVAGLGFAWLVGRRARTPGTALMWGVAYGLFWWLAVALTLAPLLGGERPVWTIAAAQAAFPLLVGLLVSYGAVLGLGYWAISAALAGAHWRMRRRQAIRPFVESITIGGLAGLVGGLAFGVWMERAGFFPLVAGLVGSDSPGVGRTLHFVISVAIGASYGVLFRPDVRGPGTSIAWGLAYGLIWWVLGPLTLLPLLLGRSAQWSLAAGQETFPSLVGHLIYGLLLGVVYAVVARLWRLLFYDSDPLHREPEGPGTRSLRSLGLGILASIAGGLVFTTVMLQTGVLPVVASLVGGSSVWFGFVVHMVISAIIGASFGLLFQREAGSYGAALAWGLVYGLAWWFLGPLTLMPSFLGAGIQWSPAAAVAAYPSLVGHLLYGGTTGLAYQALARRHDPTMRAALRPGFKRPAKGAPAPAGDSTATAAPALWALVLVAGVLLPLILGSPAVAAPSGGYGGTSSGGTYRYR